jgi:hypothetical protein
MGELLLLLYSSNSGCISEKSFVWVKDDFNKSKAALKRRIKSYYRLHKRYAFKKNNMKIILSLITVMSFLGLISYNVKKPAVSNKPTEISPRTQEEIPPAKEKSPVLVELFTSQGCSSCPPADKNLAFLEKQQPSSEAEIITLSLHVDYWNRLGWTDVFSSPKYSERQGFYSNTFKLGGEVYTPQMVVDGTHQFVGGNMNEANKAISSSAKSPKAKIDLSISGDKLKVKISELPEHSYSNVFLAVAENNLSTNVKRGENGGKILPHTSVVRELKTIGSIAAEDKSFETETAFQTPAAWKRENLKLVVFIQVERTSRIIGVNQIKL